MVAVQQPLRPRAVHPVLGLLLALVIGGFVGVISRLADSWPDPLALIGNIGGPWLVAAFIAGSATRHVGIGAMSGLLTLVVAVAAYYSVMFFADSGFSVDGLRRLGLPRFVLIWAVVTTIGGPCFGAAGSRWRHGHGFLRGGSVSLLGGALAGESIAWLLLRHQSTSESVLLTMLLVAGLSLPLVLQSWRERMVAIGLVIAFAGLGFIILLGLLAVVSQTT